MKLQLKTIVVNDRALDSKRRQIIEKVARKGVKIFKHEITKRHLINTRNLIDNVGATIKRDGVKFEIGADYAGILNDGVKRHKMRYLVDAGPIPITTSRGQTIFRVANRRNINKSGKWVHPGFKRGKGFFDISVNKIRDACMDIAIDEGLT